MLSYEICENFKNNYFEELLRTIASKFIYYTHLLLGLDVMMYLAIIRVYFWNVLFIANLTSMGKL